MMRTHGPSSAARNARLALSALCIFFLSCVILHRTDAQSTLITGVVSAQGVPVRNANVVLSDKSDTAKKYFSITDALGAFRIETRVTGVRPETTVPSGFVLEQNYPNPFSASTTISYRLDTQSDVRVTIFDILGRTVREFSAALRHPGAHLVQWDGRNDDGRLIAPGIYFCRLQARGESRVMKMIYGAAGMLRAASMPAHSEPAGLRKTGSTSVLGRTYAVAIHNTDSTLPQIIPASMGDVVVWGSDTTLNFSVNALAGSAVIADLNSTQQTIRGFGAANILPWRPDMTADQAAKAFGTGPGQIGFSILRLRIPYTDSETEFAANLPTAKIARSLGAIVFASPWTPPPAMKSNNIIVMGSLNASSYAAYAAHLKRFADYMSVNGVPLYAVSVQNEPDANVTYESCVWTASQFLEFARTHAPSIGTRVMLPEALGFNHALSDPVLNDPAAGANIAIVAGHIYGGGLAPYPLAASKGKEVWMTEHLVLDTTWSAVLATGKEIHDCLSAGMHAYLWWYIVRYYGPIHENGFVTKRGFVMSQFSRFIRPGFVKIGATAAPQAGVWVSAYKSGTKVVLVAINTNAAAVTQMCLMKNGSVGALTPYVTSASKNCVQSAGIPVVDGFFTAVLEPGSITTFVSE